MFSPKIELSPMDAVKAAITVGNVAVPMIKTGYKISEEWFYFQGKVS